MRHSKDSASTRKNRLLSRSRKIAICAVALATAFSMTAPAASAKSQPSNFTRSGPNMTLVIASCYDATDIAIAQDIAVHSRNAAAACVLYDVQKGLEDFIKRYAPDRVIIVGGKYTMWEPTVEGIKQHAKDAYRWTVVERVTGDTRMEISARAARTSLGMPASVDDVTFVFANGWNYESVSLAREYSAEYKNAAMVVYTAFGDGYPPADPLVDLIKDYGPDRIVFAGAPVHGDRHVEQAVTAALADIGSDTYIDRIIYSQARQETTPMMHADNAARLLEEARMRFNSIIWGTHDRLYPTQSDKPFLALSEAPRGPGDGLSLYTLRSDGTDRELLTSSHRGWAWNPNGYLSWAGGDSITRIGMPSVSYRVLPDEGPSWPSWSPDGSKGILFEFVSTHDDGLLNAVEAIVIDKEGTHLKRLGIVDIRTLYYAETPGFLWSPDSTKLIFQKPDGAMMLYSTDNSHEPYEIATGAIVVRWSPDSEHLLYATPDRCGKSYGSTHDVYRLWVSDKNGSNRNGRGLAAIDPWDLVITDPWSPDSTHFAYVRLSPYDCSKSVEIAPVAQRAMKDPSDAVSMTGADRVLGWSPDGNYVAFAKEDSTLKDGYLVPEYVYMVRKDGMNRHYLGELSPSAYGWVQWSPDGNYVAFTEVTRDDIWTGIKASIQRYDGSQKTTLAQRGSILGWSPDGEHLAYSEYTAHITDTSVDVHSLKIYAPGSQDTPETVVYDLPEDTRLAIWSPDGSEIIYATGSVESLTSWLSDHGHGVDVWSVPAQGGKYSTRIITDVTWGEWQPQM